MRAVAIDCFVREFPGFRPGFVVVAVDVMRATTMAVTSALLGRRCFPAATIDSGVALARGLDNPILAGELGGHKPYGFDLDNSPAALADRFDIDRPMVMVSTSGTQLMCESAHSASVVYAACLRNFTAQAEALIAHHPRVAIVGAGSRGEFREEDQLCCAWIAQRLLDKGYEALGDAAALVERWRGASVSDMLISNSVRYLRSTGRHKDLDFILEHVDDCGAVFQCESGEIVMRDE